ESPKDVRTTFRASTVLGQSFAEVRRIVDPTSKFQRHGYADIRIVQITDYEPAVPAYYKLFLTTLCLEMEQRIRIRLDFSDDDSSDEYSDDCEYPQDDSRYVDDESKDQLVIVRLDQEEDEMLDRIIRSAFYFEIEASNKSFYALKELLLEKRMIFIGKRCMFFALHTLFPFITTCDSQPSI
ncbi:MAG: hypothetical protein EZS28_043020, partial [Streblomastix strix]